MPDPALTMSPAQRLAGYLNAIDTDADASELRVDEADLIARIYNALGAGPTVSHLTTHVATMLAGIRNNLSSDPDQSAATTEVDVLFGEVLDLLEAAYGDAGDGGGGGGVPAWVQTLQALAADPSDLLFAYNFASGGTGQGWDGTNNVTLTAAQSWSGDWQGSWNPANIIDGVGLQPGISSTATTPLDSGLLPDLPDGATILMDGFLDAGTIGEFTGGFIYAHLVDQPDDNFEGGADVHWEGGVTDASTFNMENGNGSAHTIEALSPIVRRLRVAGNYLTDGSDLPGSVNGDAVTSVAGSVVGTAPNTVFMSNHAVESDLPVYYTMLAIFRLQPSASLPALSAVS